VRSRNIRLSAIRSFCRLVALRDPDSLGIVTRGLALPMQREDRTRTGSRTRTEIQALLAAPERSKWGGRRDHALLLTLSNSGARVSEVTTLRRAQVGDPRKAGRFSVGHVLCGTAFSHEFNHPTEDRPAGDFGREVA
jgi:site-specific recombinase XerD